ncbi:acetyltransferase GNAT family [Clostridium aceticum]|uniref:Acetyltransferase GNAT family n=1 Tax=Clostridium aceticum TaxID=84022 RepID=A0A0D8IAG4_9CLOT|nr:GNAT family N-acetyltransferase [Clostridium aceticum]AKL96563.1 acetyltransferase GNAT family [Clostridium aceticum]KJF27280.1 hypothetical protein TZ02_08000 [Clostridium aceticum]
MSNQIHVRRIDVEEVQIAREFLFKMVKKLFNTDENPLYHHDIINLKEAYIDNKKNTLVGAFNESGELIGTIAVKQFVDRFKVLEGMYKEEVTAELGRCYIDESLRRKGIGSLLLEELLQFCKESGYEKVYLHTHRHLPGGFDFWTKKGFVITVEEGDQEETVHMEKEVL